jgi:hypothetical protein
MYEVPSQPARGRRQYADVPSWPKAANVGAAVGSYLRDTGHAAYVAARPVRWQSGLLSVRSDEMWRSGARSNSGFE